MAHTLSRCTECQESYLSVLDIVLIQGAHAFLKIDLRPF